MKPRIALLALSTLLLSACTTLYSKDKEWKLPASMGHYVLSAKISASLFTREAAISVNGREVLHGSSFFWSDAIDMSGTVDQLPIDAVCRRSEKVCDVRIAGIHAASLKL